MTSMMNDGWHNGGWHAGTWIAMGLMMLLFWGFVVGLVVYLVRNTGHHTHPSSGADPADAVRILDERFARGEIDADEYRQRRDLLRSQ